MLPSQCPNSLLQVLRDSDFREREKKIKHSCWDSGKYTTHSGCILSLARPTHEMSHHAADEIFMVVEGKKLTKSVCGSGRNITVPAMLRKSRLNWRNYHSGDRGNLFINFALRNAFLMAQRWYVQTEKQSYSSVLSFWQTIHTLILGYVTPAAKKCSDVSFFFPPPELLAFYSQGWRVRGRRFIKIYFGLKPKF